MNTEPRDSSNEKGKGKEIAQRGGGVVDNQADAGDTSSSPRSESQDISTNQNRSAEGSGPASSSLSSYNRHKTSTLRHLNSLASDRWNGNPPNLEGLQLTHVQSFYPYTLDNERESLFMMSFSNTATGTVNLSAGGTRVIAEELEVSERGVAKAWSDMWISGRGFTILLHSLGDDKARGRATGLGSGVAVTGMFLGRSDSVEVQIRLFSLRSEKRVIVERMKTQQEAAADEKILAAGGASLD